MGSVEDFNEKATRFEHEVRCNVLCTNLLKSATGCDGNCIYDKYIHGRIMDILSEIFGGD